MDRTDWIVCCMSTSNLCADDIVWNLHIHGEVNMNLLEDKVYKEWVKSHLYERQSGKCIGCLDFFQNRNLEVDHVEAKSKGGSDEPSNLQLLCSTCNRMKGTSSQAVFLTKTAKLRKGKSSDGIDFGLSNSKIYSEHDWSFREVAEEVLREAGMTEDEVQKELRRLYPHGFLPTSKIEDAHHSALRYKWEKKYGKSDDVLVY